MSIIDKFKVEGTEVADINTLDDLLSPINKKDFFDNYFEQKPFLVSRDIKNYFSNYLSIDELEKLLYSRVFRKDDIRVAKEGKFKSHDELFDQYGMAKRNELIEAYLDGSTIVLEFFNRQHIKLGEMMYALEAESLLGMRSNVYLSPPNSIGFKKHWDSHDVFILQVEGEKLWKIYNNPLNLPNVAQTKRQIGLLENMELELIDEILLKPGDVLYLPRGYVHEPYTNESASLHITCGIRQHTVEHLLLKAVEDICNDNAEFRTIIMLDQEFDQVGLKDKLISEVNNYDFEKSKNSLFRRYIKSRSPMTGKKLTEINHSLIDEMTQLTIKKNSVYKLFDKKGTIQLYYDGKSIRFPEKIKEVLNFIVDNKTFYPKELPLLDIESKVSLAFKLYQEGFLEISSEVCANKSINFDRSYYENAQS